MTPSDQFLLDEFKALRERISTLAEELVRLELYFLGATGAIYAAYFGFGTSGAPRDVGYLLLLPILFAVYGHFRSKALWDVISTHHAYIKTVEERMLGKDSGYGFLTQKDQNLQKTRRVRSAVWLLGLAATVALPSALLLQGKTL